MSSTLKGLPYQSYSAQDGSQYTSDGNGIITGVQAGDVVSLLNLGCSLTALKSRMLTCGAIVTAALTTIVANVACANGDLTIAAQPDIPRQGVITLAPGAAAVTAGTVEVKYTDQNGVAQDEVLSLITGSGVTLTLKTKKAPAYYTKVTVAGFVGGSSPTIEVGQNTVIGLPAEPGSIGFAVFKETSDKVDAGATYTVDAANGLYTLQTTPNSAHLINVWYNYY